MYPRFTLFPFWFLFWYTSQSVKSCHRDGKVNAGESGSLMLQSCSEQFEHVLQFPLTFYICDRLHTHILYQGWLYLFPDILLGLSSARAVLPLMLLLSLCQILLIVP